MALQSAGSSSSSAGGVAAGAVAAGCAVGLAGARISVTLVTIFLPAPAAAPAASRAGAVRKIATRCSAGVLSPTGTRKNVTAASAATAALTTRFKTSPTIGARLRATRRATNFSGTA